MLVKELIEKLKKCDENKIIKVETAECDLEVEGVMEYKTDVCLLEKE